MTDTDTQPPSAEASDARHGNDRPPRPATGFGSGDPGPSPQGVILRLGLVLVGILVLASAYGALAATLVVLSLIVVIFLHELGHYLTAKWAGMKVTEFFLGFGPKLWSFRRGETEYGVKAIPAGAYVRIIGMTNLEEVDPADDDRTYRSKPYRWRLLVVSAGSLMHFAIAFGLLLVLLVGFGLPRLETFQVGALSGVPTASGQESEQPGPAERAGIRPGDRILAVDGDPIADWDELVSVLRAQPGERVELLVVRDGSRLTVPVTLASIESDDGEQVGYLGVGPEFPLQPVPPLEAVPEAAATFWDISWQSTEALVGFFSPTSLADYADQVADPAQGGGGNESVGAADDGNRFISPVGFVRIASQAAETGAPEVLRLLILINIFVGIFNLVPLLPFDGGHIAVATYERIRSRPGRRYHADVTKLLPLTYGVVLVLIVMGLSALWLDIANPIDNPFEAP